MVRDNIFVQWMDAVKDFWIIPNSKDISLFTQVKNHLNVNYASKGSHLISI